MAKTYKQYAKEKAAKEAVKKSAAAKKKAPKKSKAATEAEMARFKKYIDRIDPDPEIKEIVIYEREGDAVNIYIQKVVVK